MDIDAIGFPWGWCNTRILVCFPLVDTVQFTFSNSSVCTSIIVGVNMGRMHYVGLGRERISTHGLVTPHGDIDLAQNFWLRKQLVAWQHQAITWANVHLSSTVLWHGGGFAGSTHEYNSKHVFGDYTYKITTKTPRSPKVMEIVLLACRGKWGDRVAN